MFNEYNSDASEFVPQSTGGGGYFKGDGGGGNSSPRKSGKARNQPLIPATIYQLQEAVQSSPEEDDFVLDGQQINQVSIIGLILSVSPQATNLNYVIDDGTGQIDVRIWIDQEEPNDFIQQKSALWVEGVYVRVIGNLRAFGSKRSLVAFRLILIEDHNEISYHFLECIYGYLLATKGNPTGNTTTTTTTTQTYSNTTQHQQQQQQPVFRGGGQSVTENAADSYTPLQLAILNTVEGAPGEGRSIEDIFVVVGKMASQDVIRSELQFLSDEGHLFQTIDEEHFALTGAQ